MGADACYSNVCSGDVEGGPAVLLPPKAPNTVDCFFRAARRALAGEGRNKIYATRPGWQLDASPCRMRVSVG